MVSQLSTNELAKLKKKLPHGSMTKISIATGLDISTVSKVFSGRFHNTEVIEEALKIAKEANQARGEMAEIINQL